MDTLHDIKLRIIAMLLKLETVASSFIGWLIAVATAVYTFFLPEIYAFGVVFVAILLDAFFGLTVALGKRKDFALSKLGRITLFKISAYMATLILVFMVEKLAHDNGFIGVKVAAGWAAACEFWSMSASILILWPDAPFFKLMRKQLKGEIAAKLGQDLNDVLPEEKN